MDNPTKMSPMLLIILAFIIFIVISTFWLANLGVVMVEQREDFCMEHGYMDYNNKFCIRWKTTTSEWSDNAGDILDRKEVCEYKGKIGWCG